MVFLCSLATQSSVSLTGREIHPPPPGLGQPWEKSPRQNGFLPEPSL